ncbi:RNA polymerase sigma-70 factor [Larkinella insperata]|uniref:RNA polymerase sigma-70 factor n=1 Tax=Larkinella insperata TaxID=332158 RepID=A0ABW3QJ60_9BACT|nr:RNA polymerase sigma-70 factor [Larkinella insperata]
MNRSANPENALHLSRLPGRPVHPEGEEPAGKIPIPTDSELFIRKAFEENPETGYQLLFKRYYHPLCSHAVRFVYSREVAEDLVVDIFAQFWQKQLHRAVTTSYRAYLFTSVRHAAFAHLRSELGHEAITDDRLEPDTVNTPQQLLQYSELALKIEEIIRSLPPQSQKVFMMSRFEGKKNGMIAQELQLSIKTVEGHITKVLTILRRVLQEYGLLSALAGVSFWVLERGLTLLFQLLPSAIFLNV